MRLDRAGEPAVAFGVRMRPFVDVEFRAAVARLVREDAAAGIREVHGPAARPVELRQKRVDRLDPPAVGGLRPARQQPEEENPRAREAGVDLRDHGPDALGDLFVGALREVVRADQHLRDLGRDFVERAVADAPQHVFGAVETEAHVDGPIRPVEPLEAVGAALDLVFGHAAPVVGDRVAEEDDFGVPPAVDRHDLGVAFQPVVGVGDVGAVGRDGRDVHGVQGWLGKGMRARRRAAVHRRPPRAATTRRRRRRSARGPA